MKVTPDIIRMEFIGAKAEVVQSPHKGYIGVSGLVVDETRNTFSISQKDKVKKIVKEAAKFDFEFSDGTIVEVEGKLLVGKPEDRLKRSIKRLW